MDFVLYTTQTITQCTNAINERIQTKSSSKKRRYDGWIKKGGYFSISVSTPVARYFSRTTRLNGRIQREGGLTVIKGKVPGGVEKQTQSIILGAALVTALFVAITSDPLIGIVLGFLGAALLIPLAGDKENSQILINDLKRILKAKDTPPK
ncbi:hypothetical protein MASR2M15_07090 [Anaerolineales bacterium]